MVWGFVVSAARNCPSCGQPTMTADVPTFDLLRIAHTMDCHVGAAEDATRAADYDRLTPGFRFTRPVTPTELALLTTFGFTDATGQPPTSETVTEIGHHSPGARLRAWPSLKEPA
jgi:hypothetical protein